MLALAVLGGTYAITPGPISPTSVPKFVTYNLGYYPDLNATHPALAAFIASPTGDHLSGINVQLVKETGQRFGPTGTRFQLLQTNSTDSSGWVRFNKLWTSYPNSSLGLVYPDLKGSYFCCVSTAAAISPPYKNTGDAMWHVLSLGDSSKKTLSLVFTDTMGQPLSSADVLVWRVPNATSLQGPYDKQSPPDGWTTKYKIGMTDSSGFFINPQPYDNWPYLSHVMKGGLNSTFLFGSFDTTTPISGPDTGLAFAAVLFVPTILPIVSLALAYDAISREKSEGTLDLLLSKPVSRLGVALGKILGVVGSELVPLLIVVSSSAGLAWGIAGAAPSGSLVFGLLGSAVYLVLAYSLLFLAVSSLSRSLGSALLTSVLLFLMFGFFWSLITTLIANLAGPSGSVAWFQTYTTMPLFSPTGVYQQLLSFFISGPAFGSNVSTEAPLQSPLPWITAAATAWIIIPLFLFAWAMKYRVSQS